MIAFTRCRPPPGATRSGFARQSLHPGEADADRECDGSFTAYWLLSGPRSRELLTLLTDADLGNEQFAGPLAREISVAGFMSACVSVTFGELGWGCMRRWPHGPLYDSIWSQGRHSVLPI